jgi:hypothetical protein
MPSNVRVVPPRTRSSSGVPLWNVPIPDQTRSGNRNPILAETARSAIVTTDRGIESIDVETGARRWALPGLHSPLTATATTIIATAAGTDVLAVDDSTSAVRWRKRACDDSVVATAIDGRDVWALCGPRMQLRGFAIGSGVQRYRADLRSRYNAIAEDLVVTDGGVLVASGISSGARTLEDVFYVRGRDARVLGDRVDTYPIGLSGTRLFLSDSGSINPSIDYVPLRIGSIDTRSGVFGEFVEHDPDSARFVDADGNVSHDAWYGDARIVGDAMYAVVGDVFYRYRRDGMTAQPPDRMLDRITTAPIFEGNDIILGLRATRPNDVTLYAILSPEPKGRLDLRPVALGSYSALRGGPYTKELSFASFPLIGGGSATYDGADDILLHSPCLWPKRVGSVVVALCYYGRNPVLSGYRLQ